MNTEKQKAPRNRTLVLNDDEIPDLKKELTILNRITWQREKGRGAELPVSLPKNSAAAMSESSRTKNIASGQKNAFSVPKTINQFKATLTEFSGSATVSASRKRRQKALPKADSVVTNTFS